MLAGRPATRSRENDGPISMDADRSLLVDRAPERRRIVDGKYAAECGRALDAADKLDPRRPLVPILHDDIDVLHIECGREREEHELHERRAR